MDYPFTFCLHLSPSNNFSLAVYCMLLDRFSGHGFSCSGYNVWLIKHCQKKSVVKPREQPCHDFCRSRGRSFFGRCSAVDVTSLLAIIDPYFIFHWFCLVFLHTWFQSHSLPVVYLTLCFPSCPCQRLFVVHDRVVCIGARRVLVPTMFWLCIMVLELCF